MLWQESRYKILGVAAAVLSLLMFGGVPAVAATTAFPVSHGSGGFGLARATLPAAPQARVSLLDDSKAASGAGKVTSFPGIDEPAGITAGPDGALWFTNAGNNSIGRISTAGVVTNYTGPGIDDPEGITAGPDGALWFTNAGNNSIGRISTAGVVTNYTGTGIDDPEGITAGPDGALWFTNDGNNSIGRISTAGVVTNYTGTGIDDRRGSRRVPTAPCGSPTRPTTRSGGSARPGWSPTTPAPASTARGDHGGSRRRLVVHQRPQQLDRADQHGRGGHQLHRPGIDGPEGITAGPDGACGSPTYANNSIGRISTAGVVTNYTGTGIDDPGDHGGSRRRLVVHQLGNNSIGRISTAGVVTNYTGPGIDEPGGITAGPDGALWFTNSQQLDRADQHGRGGHQLHRPRHRRARGDHGGSRRRLVVHQRRRQLDRADQHRRGGHQLHRYRHRRARGDHGGSRRRLVVHQHRQQLDRADQHRRGGHQLHRHRHRRARGDHGGPRRRLVVHQLRRQLDRADQHAGVVTNYTGTGIDAPEGITAGPDGALWFTNTATTRSGGSARPGWSPTTPAPASATRRASRRVPTAPCGSPTQVNNSIGRISTAGVVTIYTGTGIDVPYGITAGPDGALWFTNSGNNSIGRITTAPFVDVSPSTGAPGTAVTVSGAGFTPGETITVTYKTGLASPTKVTICSTVAAAGGNFTCTGNIPTAATAGATGAHAITAKGRRRGASPEPPSS